MSFREPGLSCRAPGLRFREPALGEPPWQHGTLILWCHLFEDMYIIITSAQNPQSGDPPWAHGPCGPGTPGPRTHSLTHSQAHSLAQSLAHSLTHSLARSLAHSLTHSRQPWDTPGARHPRDSKPHHMGHSREPRTPNHPWDTRETLNSARYPPTVNGDPNK